MFCQPIYQLVEEWLSRRGAGSDLVAKEHPIVLRLIWRTGYVIITCVIAMIFPVFNSVLGLIGALSFWPLTVYFPVEMYISQAHIRKFSPTWIWLNILTWACLIIALAAAAACVQGIIIELNHYQPFNSFSWCIFGLTTFCETFGWYNYLRPFWMLYAPFVST